MAFPLLDVRNLCVEFPPRQRNHSALATPTQSIVAVHDLNFTIAPGEVLGLVGESGSGKSVTSLAIMQLLPPEARATGKILFSAGENDATRYRNVLESSPAEVRSLRGSEMTMIFQEPMTALNPVMRVGEQIAEAISAHSNGRGSRGRKEAWERAVAAMNDVAIPDPERRARDYPHQLSGGMRQRVMIAMAIACRPPLLIADEPTTALDATVQAQVLELIQSLGRELGTATILITHNLGIVAGLCDRVAVVTLQLPPLRERRDDIPLLLAHFLNKARRGARPTPDLLWVE